LEQIGLWSLRLLQQRPERQAGNWLASALFSWFDYKFELFVIVRTIIWRENETFNDS
jgi:hypothetical protein